MTHDFPDGPETPLPAGDVTVGVVRVGDTVRRPNSDSSTFVAGFLSHLERVGFEGAPRYLGCDRQGRDVLTFVEGDVPGDPVEAWATDDGLVPGVASLVRRLHDASEGYAPPQRHRQPGRPVPRLPVGESLLVAHRDVTPQNTVFRRGTAHAVIDFDLSDWTTRSIDLANAAMHWVPLLAPVDRARTFGDVDVVHRLGLLLDAYGRDVMSAGRLLRAARLRFTDGYAVMRWNAEHLGGGWARMWDDGVGDLIRRRVSWFEAEHASLERAVR